METFAVLASGPSMSQAVADAVRDLRVIVVNTTFRLAPWAEILYAADEQWWRETPDAMRFAGRKVSIKPNTLAGLEIMENTGDLGFDPKPGCLRTGNNSGYQAVHLAAQLGARRILLCGFDMGGGHWHGRHPAPLRDTPQEYYAKWARNFESLAKDLDARGVEVINCTPGSRLSAWPIVPLAEALAAETA